MDFELCFFLIVQMEAVWHNKSNKSKKEYGDERQAACADSFKGRGTDSH